MRTPPATGEVNTPQRRRSVNKASVVKATQGSTGATSPAASWRASRLSERDAAPANRAKTPRPNAGLLSADGAKAEPSAAHWSACPTLRRRRTASVPA